MIVAGLMSGTSADGTDVALVEISGHPPALDWRVRFHTTVPHPPALRQAILECMRPETSGVDRLCWLNAALGEQFAASALLGIHEAGLSAGEVHLVGSHGQTVWHAPQGQPPATLQLGEGAVIAERTGITVVSNFRARDVAAGGQGAPLVAYIDALLFTGQEQVRAAQNVGGIGNVTFLPPRSEPGLPAFAFDTGPGNVLLDETAAYLTRGEWSHDRDGALAAGGQPDERLLSWLLDHPFLQRPPPKTTGREEFGYALAREVWQRAEQWGIAGPALMATLTAYTAETIAGAYRRFLPRYPEVIIASGGGARNPEIMRRLAAACAPARLMTCEALGELGLPAFSGQAKEALAFAILAYESWHGRPGNLPAATGAGRAVVLGQITPGQARLSQTS
jgi:anhydro-N-acetylmuramic acid kinase